MNTKILKDNKTGKYSFGGVILGGNPKGYSVYDFDVSDSILKRLNAGCDFIINNGTITIVSEAKMNIANDIDKKAKIFNLSTDITLESGKLKTLIELGEDNRYIEAKTSLVATLMGKLKAIETEIGIDEMIRLQQEIDEERYSNL